MLVFFSPWKFARQLFRFTIIFDDSNLKVAERLLSFVAQICIAPQNTILSVRQAKFTAYMYMS